MTTRQWFPLVFLSAALAAGCSGSKGADGAPGIASAALPLRLDVSRQLSLDAASATSAGALSASDWAAFNAKLSGTDPRLSDARQPLPGSASYIQNGTTAQAGDLSVTGGVTAGAVIAATVTANTFALASPVIRVLALPPTAFSPTVSGTTFDGQVAGASRWISAGNWPTWLVAPVHLPDGAVIQNLRCHVINSSATQTVGVYFFTLAGDGSMPTGGAVETSLASASTSVQTLNLVLGGTVDNSNQSYQVGFLPSYSAGTCGSACQILGCWLTYRLLTAP